MRVPRSELEEVLRWCETEKQRRRAISFVTENPFREKFSWARNYRLLAVDRSPESLPPNSLIYDSATRSLYVRYGNVLIKIEGV